MLTATKGKYFIEDAYSHLVDMMFFVDAVADLNLDMSPTLRVIAGAPALPHYTAYSPTEEALTEVADAYLELQEQAVDRLAAMQ